MKVMTQAGREYWRAVLTEGDATTIPRWTLDPRPGLADRTTEIDEGLTSRLRALSDLQSVPLTSVLLAAHAAVVAALSGGREIVTGYQAKAGRCLPCRVSTVASSWSELIARTHDVETMLHRYQEFPVDGLRPHVGLTRPRFETEFDLTDHDPPVGNHTVARVVFAPHGRTITVGIRYRTDAFDEASAARIAGYHVAVLDAMASDPDADPSGVNLLSSEERRFQIEGLAGPRRDLPDLRFHELFEQRAHEHPAAIAALHGDESLSYGELNARANRLGRALVARGVRAETVVGVVTERNLDWMVAVLAIFKAGGVYLPIEPHFPADRIAATLTRADCDLVVTEPASTTMLDEALETLPGTRTLLIETVDAEGHAEDDLGVPVATDQLAYIYFTSGSTGAPKGAMCEHGGFLNHLYAKIDDFGIEDGQTVAQVAPQCFDISLWQLVSALLVGGRTLIVDQDTILDPGRFLDTIVDRRVAILQVVPSYLEVLLSSLDRQPRELSDLRCVSVTGEAVTLDLVQRWFETVPGIKLANAYGLTETSDDTNHEVMTEAPDRGGVPLGPAVNNVHVHVVDEHLSLVPLGAPGEIVFSGICVGRGYINDPERTSAAYTADPIRPGNRLYRSGDFGRWRPDGKLEFLGRRDAQVKIRGFRIEIGEIENTMQHQPEIRQCAVVITDPGERSAQLIAFYSGEQVAADELADRLGRTLPEYMVPASLHWQQDLPLTANGKVDRKTLTALAADIDTDAAEAEPVATDAEHRLAAAWAAVLDVPVDRIGRHDDFFDRGGSSLLAVELVIAMGGDVTLKQVTRHPVLADMALQLDRAESSASASLLQPLTELDQEPDVVLVCFPYAGGNAVNFTAMARTLAGSGVAIRAVELPGHELAADPEPFAPLEHVVEQVVDELTRLPQHRIMLWGHSSGAAYALAAARQLERSQVDVERVFVGAQLMGDATERRAAVRGLRRRSDGEIAGQLSSDGGYTELRDLERSQALQIGAAYRHDCIEAHRYLAGLLEDPPDTKLSAPITVVVSADDPVTVEWPSRYAEWSLLSDDVDVHDLPDGGHYFLRTRPDDAADAVLQSTRQLDRQR